MATQVRVQMAEVGANRPGFSAGRVLEAIRRVPSAIIAGVAMAWFALMADHSFVLMEDEFMTVGLIEAEGTEGQVRP